TPPPISTLFPYTTLFRSLAETPTLLVEVHGSEAAVAEAWAAAADVLRGAGGEPLVLPGGRDAWSIREHATRSIAALRPDAATVRSEEHTSELQSRFDLVC